MNEIIVNESFVALLYEDGVYTETLQPGKHTFEDKQTFFERLFHPPEEVRREAIMVDLRERSLTIKGQEILTADKVAIRVSILVYFKVTDPLNAVHNVASYEVRIYEDVQLAARRYLASRPLDHILKDRNEISDAVRDAVKGSAASYGVEIIRADVKDLVFPGNLKDIMNQVLETERRSEARLIEAKKQAEAQKIRIMAQNEEMLLQLETEKEQIRLKAEAEAQKSRLKLEAELEEAKALATQPELLRIKQLQVLKDLAASQNGKFILGLNGVDLEEGLNKLG